MKGHFLHPSQSTEPPQEIEKKSNINVNGKFVYPLLLGLIYYDPTKKELDS
jgi:hypothetical protein